MTKDFQKQLLKEVKPGVKPSDIKRLKRSKSADDIANTPTSSVPLKKSQSQLEIPLPQLSSEQATNLKEQVKFHADTAQNYLQSLQTSQAKVSELEGKLKQNPPNALLQDQLKEKQKQIENLREKLEKKEDQILELRLENIQDFGKYREQLKQISKELDDTVEQASEEMISKDDQNSQLRTKLFTARQQISSLQKDFDLASKLAEMRRVPYPDDNPNWDYLKPLLYALGAITLTIWLLRTNN